MYRLFDPSPTKERARVSPVFFEIGRQDVEKGLLSDYVEGLEAFSTNTAMLGSAVLIFSGYDDDPRGLWEIPEVRRWFAQLNDAVPHLLYLLDPEAGMARLYLRPPAPLARTRVFIAGTRPELRRGEPLPGCGWRGRRAGGEAHRWDRAILGGVMSAAALDQVEWTTTPSAFELLEDGQLEEDRPAWDRIALPRASRSLADDADATASASRWSALVRRLRGYRRDAVLISDEPVWVPIVDVHAPFGGGATFTYSFSSTATHGLRLSILGARFGSAASLTLRTSLKVPAASTGKSVRLRMLVTAIRYVSTGKLDLIRVDVRQPEDGTESQVIDIASPQLPPDLSDVLKWRVLHRERLSGAHDADQPTWSYGVGTAAKWEIGLDPALGALGTPLTLSAEAEHADETQVEFVMPYGRDYVFYVPAGHNPLVPICAIEP